MSIKITRTFEVLTNLSNFENAKIGITVSSSTECETPEQVKETSTKLLKFAKVLVNRDVEELKIEKGIKTN